MMVTFSISVFLAREQGHLAVGHVRGNPFRRC